jgi:cytochrome P450
LRYFYASIHITPFSTLIFAAMDTTSGALGRILSTLAEHPDAQDKLRQELSEARKRAGDLGYDELSLLPYLDAICRETLRLWGTPSILY